MEEVVEEIPNWVTPQGVKQDVSNTVPIPVQEPEKPKVVTPPRIPAPVKKIVEPVQVVNVVEETLIVEEIEEPVAVTEAPHVPKSKRAAVPSWDEILFGSKGGQ